MTEPRLTSEIVNEYEMMYEPYGKDKFIDDTTCGTGRWDFVGEGEQNYDEGTVTSQLVWRHVESGELWAIDYESNSWCDYYDVSNTYRVEPEQKNITVYTKA